MNRLLNKTLLYYLILSTAVLILSGPCFYWLMEKLYLDDVEEAILLRRDEFFKNNQPTLKVTDIGTWNRFNRDTRIFPDTIHKTKNKIIHETFLDAMVPEWEPYLVLYQDIKIQQKPYILMIRLNLVESEDLITALTWLYLGVLFVLLLVIFLITRLISSSLWHPFYDTLSKIEEFNIEQKIPPVFTNPRIAEFQQLNKALNKLISDNIGAYQIQKEFTENASHELQTPLAIFQSKLDMLLQQPVLTQEHGEILQSLYTSVKRLSRVNKNLLLLAKIENNQFPEKETVDIVAIIDEVLPYFTEQGLANNLQVAVQKETNELNAEANKGLCEIMVNNLILNSISHNKPDGYVSIVLTSNTISIINPGTAGLITATLFKRFSKVSANAYSTGLGLAIVEKICASQGWHVTYGFENQEHIFTVTF